MDRHFIIARVYYHLSSHLSLLIKKFLDIFIAGYGVCFSDDEDDEDLMSVRETMQSLLLREYSTGLFLYGHQPYSYTGYQNHFLWKKRQ